MIHSLGRFTSKLQQILGYLNKQKKEVREKQVYKEVLDLKELQEGQSSFESTSYILLQNHYTALFPPTKPMDNLN